MRKVMSRLWKLAPAVLTVAGFLIAGEARAQCSDSNPEMKCPLATCQFLQSIVKSAAACGDFKAGVQQPKSCNGISGCAALQAMRGRWEACRDARIDINVTCFSGGNPGHQTAADQAALNVANCSTRIALPEPTGCADPCP
jgi:hypothetical protein